MPEVEIHVASRIRNNERCHPNRRIHEGESPAQNAARKLRSKVMHLVCPSKRGGSKLALMGWCNKSDGLVQVSEVDCHMVMHAVFEVGTWNHTHAAGVKLCRLKA